MSKRGNNNEAAGNAQASQAAFTRTLLGMAESVHRAEAILGRLDDEDVFVRSFRLTPPNLDRTEWLLVITADGPEGAIVAFHSESTLFDTLRTGLARLENGSLKWREDQYRK